MAETRSTKTSKGLGQNGLYWKLCRMVGKSFAREAEDVDGLFRATFNGGKTHKDLDKGPFKDYFDQCQEASIRMWGISAFDEDKKSFTEQ
jgi:hypothetical protein